MNDFAVVAKNKLVKNMITVNMKVSARIVENNLLFWKPSLVINFYGTNDARYRAYTDAIGRSYDNALLKIYASMKAHAQPLWA